jgi:hypothetical protein
MDSTATYCQDVDPPEQRKRVDRAVPAGAGKSPDDAGNADVFELGGHPPRRPWGTVRGPAITVALAALVAGLVLGFIGGYRQATANGRPTRPATSATNALALGDTAIAGTGNQCAVQLGHALQLGVEIVNQSDRTVTLRQIEPVLPIGGLKAVASQWGTCGALPDLDQVQSTTGQSTTLGPGATGWLTVTFDVMISCPQPLPVQFKISYMLAGSLGVADLNGFADLGQVHYSNCGTNPLG